jgi:hypothetical protein
MITDWTVMPGESVGGGVGPGAASGGKYVINTGSEEIKLYFVGVGLSVGGPASFTFSDSKTPGVSGKLITAGYGVEPSVKRLTMPTDGLLFNAGTAPRAFFGGGADDIAGGYIQILMFGVIDSMTAITSFGIDHSFGDPNGGFFTGAYAYTYVATAAKGVDAGGAAILKGTWIKS